MKKCIVIVAVLLLVFAASSFGAKKTIEIDDGQPEQIYENCITTNAWPWIASLFNVGYERMIGSSFGLRPRAFYWGWSGDVKFFGFGVDAYFHPMAKGISGWFVGPRYDAWIATGGDASGIMHWIGGMGGYKFIFEGGFTLGVALGAQVNVANSVSVGSSSADLGTIAGTLAAFDLELGWAF